MQVSLALLCKAGIAACLVVILARAALAGLPGLRPESPAATTVRPAVVVAPPPPVVQAPSAARDTIRPEPAPARVEDIPAFPAVGQATPAPEPQIRPQDIEAIEVALTQ